MKTRDGMKAKSIFGTVTTAALLLAALGGNAMTAGETEVHGFAPWSFGGIESRQEMLRKEHEQVMEQLRHAASAGGGTDIAAFEVVGGDAGLTGFRPWDTAKSR